MMGKRHAPTTLTSLFLHTLRGIAKPERICNTLKRDKNIPFFYILTLYSS